MKFTYSILFLCILFVGCAPAPDNSAIEAFEKNSKTVMSYLEGFQNESLDYSTLYSDDMVLRGTSFGAPDSISLEEIMGFNKDTWERYDFELVTDPLVLLPGVDVDTKLADGSVRYYAVWKVTKPGTDSTEAKSGEIKLYESFDFDDDGKIVFQQYYADGTGLFTYLDSE
jgi:hypothetical protein